MLCVYWPDSRTSNVMKTDVKPKNPAETVLAIDQDVIVRWGRNKVPTAAKIYSLSAVSKSLNKPPKRKSAKLSSDNGADADIFTFGETHNDEDVSDDRSISSDDVQVSHGLQVESRPLTPPLRSCAGCQQVNDKLDLMLERQARLEKDILLHTQQVKLSCHENATQARILCQQATTHSPLLNRINMNVDNIHTILTVRAYPNPEFQLPTDETMDDRSIASVSGFASQSPLPVLTTPFRTVRPATQAILDPPVINDNGHAVISDLNGNDLEIPLDVFNSAVETECAAKFAVKLVGHVFTADYLATKTYRTLQIELPCKIILREAHRRFPNASIQKIKKGISNKCSSFKPRNVPVNTIPTTAVTASTSLDADTTPP